jgi:hypothetical protein
MARLRMVSLVVGWNVAPLRRFEVETLVDALMRRLVAFKDQLRGGDLTEAERSIIKARSNIARKIIQMITSGEPIWDSRQEIAEWRKEITRDVRRRIAGRCSTTIQITHEDPEPDPWMEEADRRLAERNDAPHEGEGDER